MRIQGATVHLRTLALLDVGKTHLNSRQDVEVAHDSECRDSEQARRSLILSAVVTNNGGHYVGNIKIGPVSPKHGIANVLVNIGDEGYWKKGTATEAIRLATRYAFSYLGLRRLIAGASAHNAAAVRAHEEAGFQLEGIRRGQTLGNGFNGDRALMGMVAADWSAQLPLTLPIQWPSEEHLVA
jgi:RimJ/RimL family protein N-acetyltransferase